MGTSIFNKYPRGCDFAGKAVLNIGCGFAQYKHPNVVNVDAFDVCHPDLVWDLNKAPYPLRAESFDLILANHIIEHLPNWWDCFNECARLLKPGGQLEIWVPGGGSDSIFGYRDHVNQINHCSFYGSFGTYREASNAWAVDNARCQGNRLKFVEIRSSMEKKWWITKAPQAIKGWIWRHLRNVTIEDGYIFEKVSELAYQAEQEIFNARNPRRDPALQVL